MSGYAILVSGRSAPPTVVRIAETEAGLEIKSAGATQVVQWWRLYRTEDDQSTHFFRRLDDRNWELRVTSGADRQLLAHIGRRPVHRVIHVIRRFEGLKVAVGLFVLAITLGQHAPAEWTAGFVPEWAQKRLMDGIVAQNAPNRCGHQGGEAAVRKLIDQLEPQLGPKIDIVALNDGAFINTAAPDNHIVMFQSNMNEIDSAALPALLAHQIAHIEHGDAIKAVVRRNGLLGTWGMVMDQGAAGSLQMEFSGLEEQRADLEAMQMMRRAGMPLKPAAEMFEKMRISKEQGSFFGYDERDFHYGIDRRSQRWAAAAASDPPGAFAALTPAEQDALFNFCWRGPIIETPNSKKAPRRQAPMGAGALPSHAANQ